MSTGLTRAGSCANHKLPLCRVEEGCHQSTRSVSSVPDHMQDATAGCIWCHEIQPGD
ncbi:hypothetical protein E2562_006711 [Oryza meyeriana var. granulata]|uniref:Uncharacterized protein n=1 Tax=Oryza meyeriana var. granulata TaxID=110450 RepID=A0A6G1EH55_9ORYZ|nr:hypothetical protein E2562_006711 [Oryza meyeriana var. granulata]